MSTTRALFTAAMALMLMACATAGSTFRSGVGDTLLDQPPWYAGARMAVVGGDTTPIVHLPIGFQRGATQPAVFDPSDAAGTSVHALLGAMNGWLDSSGVSVRVRGSALPGVAPDVRFGCIPEMGVPGNDCAERGDSALGRGRQYMQLSVGRPSTEWIKAVNEMVDTASARVLVITLEVGQYLVRQEGLAGNKRVSLGTGHEIGLPWLTSLETPVSVLQLTGALVDRRGQAVRIGAEGFHVRRTTLAISALGAQELLNDDDVRAAMSSRRTDLPGAPLAWQVALESLVEQLTGRGIVP
jgi:hypothetical protein